MNSQYECKGCGNDDGCYINITNTPGFKFRLRRRLRSECLINKCRRANFVRVKV